MQTIRLERRMKRREQRRTRRREWKARAALAFTLAERKGGTEP